jgi:hypothetical protein
MSTLNTLLIFAGCAAIIFWLAPKIMRAWRSEKSHHKQLVADRKNKEADFPD